MLSFLFVDESDTFDHGDINFALDASNLFENDAPVFNQVTRAHTASGKCSVWLRNILNNTNNASHLSISR